MLCATNGIFTQAHREILESFEQKGNFFENPKVILGFDKDEIGEKNTNKAKECFKEFEVELATPFLKDFNDDLIARKLLESRDYKKEEELSKEVMNLTLEVCNHQLESYNTIESKLDNKSRKDLHKETIQYVARIDFLLKKAERHLDTTLKQSAQKNLKKFIESSCKYFQQKQEKKRERNKAHSISKGISKTL